MPETRSLKTGCSCKQSLRYIKQVIKSLATAEGKEITLHSFHAALMNDLESTCRAFQQLIFDRHDVIQPIEFIEQRLQRWKSLLTSAATCQYTTEVNEREQNTRDYTLSILSKVITDLYHYLSRNSALSQSMLKCLKLLKKKYSKELKWMTELERRCAKIFKGKTTLTKTEFHHVIQYQKELADRIFNKFDKSRTGTLNITELYDGLVDILTSNTEGRLRYLFDIYDSDGNGTLSRSEVDNVLHMCISENNLDFHEDLIAELSNIVWSNITEGDSQHITFEQFYETLQKYPAVYSYLDVNLTDVKDTEQVFRFLKRKKPKFLSRTVGTVREGCMTLGTRCTSNSGLWALIALYLTVSIVLVVERVIRINPTNEIKRWYLVAKIAGQLLNFNISLTVLLTLRHIPFKVQKVGWTRRLFPFDDMLFLHKLVSYSIFIFTLVHIGAHGCLIGVKLFRLKDISPNFYMEEPYQLVFWSAIALSAVFLLFVISVMSSLRFKYYEVFIRLHQACAATWLVCLLLHASNFWKWILAPACLYSGEKIFFAVKMVLNRTVIQTGVVHNNIVQLTIKRPKYFKFKPGDYVNINIPSLSKHEWHSFTISSSPLQQTSSDTFTLHIRKVGSWTGLLHKAVTQHQQNAGIKFSRPSVLTLSTCVSEQNSSMSSQLDKNFNDLSREKRSSQTRSFNQEESNLELQMAATCNLEAASSTDTVFTIGDSSSDDSDEDNIPENHHVEKTNMSDQDNATHNINNSPVYLAPANKLESAEMEDKETEKSSVPRRSLTVDISKVTKLSPVEKRATASNSTASLNLSSKSSLANLSRCASRSSIFTIDMESVPELGWKVYLDGPYTTPSREILHTKHAILVAGGIGITPFSSVLEAVINLLTEKSAAAHCCCQNQKKACKKHSLLKRIDFFWLTRDQSHLSWFHQVFKEIEVAQSRLGLDPPLVNLHIYLTGLKRPTDIRGAFLQLALEMIYEEDSLDVLSGLQAKTQAGRPNWSKVLDEIIDSDLGDGKKSTPKLYACGPNSLCYDLQKVCYRKNIPYKQEVF